MTVTGSTPTHAPPVRRPDGRDSFLLPDGSRVTIDAPGLDTSGRWNCLFLAHIAGRRESFTVAPRQGDRAAPEGFGDVTAHPYRGAELLLAYNFREREMMASWQGRWHELINSRTSRKVGPEPFLPIFGAFQITDTPEGLLAKPGRHASLEPLRVFKDIPGIGELHIQRPHQADTRAPGWRGAQARHGEMWRAKGRDDGTVKRAREDVLILGTPTALTQLMANPGDTADDEEAAAFLSDLNVTWSES